MAQYTFGNLLDFEFSKIALPSGYTKLNYIENKGNASTYINTNYVANANTKLRALVSINTTGYNSMGYIGTYRYGFNLNVSGIYYYVNTSNYYYAVTSSIGQKRLIEIDNISKNVSLDGVVLGTMPTISYPIGGTYWIGRLNNFNAEYFNGKIFYHEFLENGISVQKMIPCEDSNGNMGMYDTVTDTFFSNQGTNPFISGGEAPTTNYQNGDTCTITDLGITLTSNGTDWYVTNNITIPTLSQATQLFSFAKGNNGVTVTVTSTGGVYKYEVDSWQKWYTIIPPLVFKGFTFEQTDFWQIPESVFRGFSFEQTDFWQIPESVFRGFSFEQTDFWQIPESVFRGFSFEYIDRKNGVSPLFFGQD